MRDKFTDIVKSGESAAKMLVDLGEAYISYFTDHKEYFRMMHFLQTPQFHKQVSDAMKEACSDESDKNWEMFTGLFARGMKERKIRDDVSPEDLAIVIWSNASSLLMRIDSEYETWMKRRNIDLHKTLEVSFRMMIDAILTPQAHREYETILQNAQQSTQHS